MLMFGMGEGLAIPPCCGALLILALITGPCVVCPNCEGADGVTLAAIGV
jgi:hypothetical protein